ncbi:hypothetical protein PV08_05520 [Exophiala spinifera]|uniref:GH16 domain-containing protein n=1 Tax=Exophiala spinifera TaxID=91928 RepID=A0A0D2BW54_9EURO|nr:uncharacterized protein PV08_05520 [Exophiala spinifera]KIW15474.1 hypothetical protein PV08_05520 [Exophiala spinifera]
MMKVFCAHAILAVTTIFLDQTNAQCNPLNDQCSPIPGLPTSTYSIDFTQQTGLPSDWIQAEGAPVTFGKNGANFTIGKRFDAPYIWTRFYVLFGRIETVVKIAPGTGIVTSAVMMSDDLDEIDWEWSGNNFAQSSGRVQTNWFGKGIPGTYDRGSQPQVDNPQGQYHTYVFDWTPDTLTWLVDGSNVYTTKNSHQTSSAYQYPQTPSRLHLGVWAAGDQDNNPATVWWAGGYSNFSLAPFSAFVKSVKITTSYPCPSWQFPNPFNGTYQAVLCTDQTITLPCTYTVKSGDNGQTIANSLEVTLGDLKAANPGLNWDLLVAGQPLNVPGGSCAASTPVSSATTQSTSSISSTSQSLSGSSTTTSFIASSLTPSSISTTSPTNSPTSLMSTSASNSLSSATTNVDTSSPVQTWASFSISSMPSSLSGTSVPDSTNYSTTLSTTSVTNPAQTPSASTYTVVAGDFGWAIAGKLGCNFDALLSANPSVDWDELQIGQTLSAPCATGHIKPTGSSSIPETSAPVGNSVSLSSVSVPASASASASATSSISASETSTNSAGHLDLPISSASATSSVVSSSVAPSRSGSNDSASSTDNSSSSSASYASSAITSSSIGQSEFTSAVISSNSESAFPTSSIASPSSTNPASPDRTTTTAAANPPNQQMTSTNTPSQNVVNPTHPATATKMVCNQDNCLRNMIDKRYSSSMVSFCSGYTGIASNPAPLPTFLTGCSTNVNRVSSACSCLMTSYASAHSSSTTPAMTVGAQKAGTPSWRLKRSPLRWERLVA